MPARSSSRSRFTNIDRDMAGTPAAIDEKVVAPNSRLRTRRRLHRSARISVARATGQYCR